MPTLVLLSIFIINPPIFIKMKFTRPSKRGGFKTTYRRYCRAIFKFKMNRPPRNTTPRQPIVSPRSSYENIITDERMLHKCRVATIRDWINTYRKYAHTGNSREWALLALKAAVTLITYAAHTMGGEVKKDQATLGEGQTEEETENNKENEDGNEYETYAREKKEERFGEIVNLECSVKLLLKSFEAGDEPRMIENRIRECQRVLIMIVGTDEHGVVV